MVLLFLTLLAGPHVAANPTWAKWLTLSRNQLAIIIPLYGFAASALPVWLLLCPRDYLSTYMKLGVILMLVGGIAFVHPRLEMHALTPFIHGGGPIIPGTLFPFSRSNGLSLLGSRRFLYRQCPGLLLMFWILTAAQGQGNCQEKDQTDRLPTRHTGFSRSQEAAESRAFWPSPAALLICQG